MAVPTVLTWFKGNTKRVTVNVTDVNTGQPVVLTGGSVHFTFTNKQTGNQAFQKSTPAASGITLNTNSFVVAIAPTDTASLAKGDYIMQAKVTLAGGDVATVLDAVVTLKEGYA